MSGCGNLCTTRYFKLLGGPVFTSTPLSTSLERYVATVLRDRIVLVTGSTGSGKSSTLAVLLDAINREKYYHIITKR